MHRSINGQSYRSDILSPSTNTIEHTRCGKSVNDSSVKEEQYKGSDM
jgi:hypothetical protein